jgi:exonuclease III
MLLLSLNVRGIGGTLKAASFRRLIDQSSPEIVFLQETLVSAQKARDFFLIFVPSWAICSVNSVGSSGGLLVAWDTRFFELSPFLTVGGIC